MPLYSNDKPANWSDVQNQKAITAYFSSKPLLYFGFAVPYFHLDELTLSEMRSHVQRSR